MTRRHTWMATVMAAAVAVTGCGDDDSAAPATTSTVAPISTTTSSATTTTGAPSTTTTEPQTTTTIAVDCGLGLDGTHTVDMVEGPRSYDLYLPPGLTPGAPAPVMVLFHGFTSTSGEIAATTGLGALAPEMGVVLAVPQGAGEPTSWHIADPSFDADIAFTTAVLDQLVASPCVDAGNVWLAGFSAGSAWSAVYGCAHADRLAGLVLVSGLAPPICPDNDAPILQITHGTADPVVPFDGGDQPVDGASVPLDSVPVSAAGWAAKAGCPEPPSDYPLNAEVAVTSWTGCAAGAAVTLHAIAGGGHAWPVGAFNPGCVALRTMLAAPDAYEPCV